MRNSIIWCFGLLAGVLNAQTIDEEFAYKPYPILLVHGFNATPHGTWGIDNPKGDIKTPPKISTIISAVGDNGTSFNKATLGNGLIYALDPNTFSKPYPKSRPDASFYPLVNRQKLGDADVLEYKDFECPIMDPTCGGDRLTTRFSPLEEPNSYSGLNHTFVEVYSPYHYNESDDGPGVVEPHFNINAIGPNPPTTPDDYDISFGGQTQLVRIRIIQMLNEYYGDWKWVGDPKAKIKIVCHSNGGLIVTNALKQDEDYWRQLGGYLSSGDTPKILASMISGKSFRLRDNIDQVITIDTPYEGSSLATPFGRRLLTYSTVGTLGAWFAGTLSSDTWLVILFEAAFSMFIAELGTEIAESSMGGAALSLSQDPVYADFKPGSAFINNMKGASALPPTYMSGAQIPYVNYVGLATDMGIESTVLAVGLWVGSGYNVYRFVNSWQPKYLRRAVRWALPAIGFTGLAYWAYNSDFIVKRESQDMNSIFPTSKRKRVRRLFTEHWNAVDHSKNEPGEADIFNYLNGETRLEILGAIGQQQLSYQNDLHSELNTNYHVEKVDDDGTLNTNVFENHPILVGLNEMPPNVNGVIHMTASTQKPKTIVGNLKEYYMNHDTVDVSVNGGQWSRLAFNQDFGKYDSRWYDVNHNYDLVAPVDAADTLTGSLVFATVDPNSFGIGENSVRLRVRSAFGQDRTASVTVTNGQPLLVHEVNSDGTSKIPSLLNKSIRGLPAGIQNSYYFSIDTDIDGASGLNTFALGGLNGELPFSKVNTEPAPGQFRLISTSTPNRYILQFTFGSAQLGKDAQGNVAPDQLVIFNLVNLTGENVVKFAPFYVDPLSPAIQVESPPLVGDFDGDGYLTANDHCQGPTSTTINPPIDCNQICTNAGITDPAECTEAKNTCASQGPVQSPGLPDCDGEDNDFDGLADANDLSEGSQMEYYSPKFNPDNTLASKPVNISFTVNDDLQALVSNAKEIGWSVQKVVGTSYRRLDPIIYTKTMTGDDLTFGKNVVDYWAFTGADRTNIDGMYCVVVTAQDQAGSGTDQTVSSPACFIIDTKPPAFSIVKPWQDQRGYATFNKSSENFSMSYKPGAPQDGQFSDIFDSQVKTLKIRFLPQGPISLVLPAFVWPHFQASAVEQNRSAEVLEVSKSPRC